MQHSSQSKATQPPPATTTKPQQVVIGLYDLHKTIGRGNFAVVKAAKHKLVNCNVAIKIIDKTRLKDEDLVKVQREVRILKELRHPHIIKLYQVMETHNFLYLVTEYAEKGEVFELIGRQGRVSEREAQVKYRQICYAIKYMHDLGYVHRDLKAENILIDSKNNIKIADFGFANNYSSECLLDTWCGSPPYSPPEIFEGKRYTGPEIDIWSLGVILYVLICGALPFDGPDVHTLRQCVLSGLFRIPFFMSLECEDLIKHMLVRNASKRFTIDQVLSHPWLRCSSDPNPSLMEENQATIHAKVMDILRNVHKIKEENLHEILESKNQRAFNAYSALYDLLYDTVRGCLVKRFLFFNASKIDTQQSMSDDHLPCGGGSGSDLPPARNSGRMRQPSSQRSLCSFRTTSSGLGSSVEFSSQERFSSFDVDGISLNSSSPNHLMFKLPSQLLKHSSGGLANADVVTAQISSGGGGTSGGGAADSFCKSGKHRLLRQTSLRQCSFDASQRGGLGTTVSDSSARRRRLLKRASLPMEEELNEDGGGGSDGQAPPSELAANPLVVRSSSQKQLVVNSLRTPKLFVMTSRSCQPQLSTQLELPSPTTSPTFAAAIDSNLRNMSITDSASATSTKDFSVAATEEAAPMLLE